MMEFTLTQGETLRVGDDITISVVKAAEGVVQLSIYSPYDHGLRRAEEKEHETERWSFGVGYLPEGSG